MKVHFIANFAIVARGSLLLVTIWVIVVGCSQKTKEAAPFRIIATDNRFEAPDRVAAGMRHVMLENRGTEIHEAMLVKLPAGMTPDDYVAEVKAGSLFPKGALDYSGVGLISPGQTSEMWLKVDPGQYLIICWNDGHARKVPVHPFVVDNAVAVDDPVPKEDVAVKLVDYRFEVSGHFRKGEQVIRVETPGPSMHEIDLFRLHPEKSIDDVRAWRKADGKGPAPADALGGALDSHDLSRVVWLRKNLLPGRYVLHCEMPVTNEATGSNTETTHADLGMVLGFEITD